MKPGRFETLSALAIKWIADDTTEIEENDYYIYLALLHASEDKVFSFEEPELTADDDLIEREDETDMQHSSAKRSRRMAATAGDFLLSNLRQNRN